MLKVERCMQFRLMLCLIIREHSTSTIKDRTPFGSTLGAIMSTLGVPVSNEYRSSRFLQTSIKVH
jgi:hypothetical protein